MAYVAPTISRNVLLLAKQEDPSTPGTEAAGITGANALPIDGNMVPYQQDIKMIAVNPVRPSFTKRKQIVGRSLVNLTFDAFLQGSGGSGGVKPWFVFLLEACGLSITNTATAGGSTSWVLKPTNTPTSVSFHYYAGSVRQKVLGAYGNCKFAFPAGDAPKMSFTFTGIWQAHEDNQAQPTPTYPGQYVRQVELEGFTLTPGVVGGGAWADAICTTFSLDLGVKNNEREDVNSAKGFYGLFEGDRVPVVDATIERQNRINYFDPTALAQAASDVDITWTHGSNAAGSKATFQLNEAQMMPPNETDTNGRKTWACKFNGQNDTDNNDLSITFYEKV